MGKQGGLNRRDFLKKTAVGTAGLTAGLSLLKPDKAQAATGGWPATGTMDINPNISNLRVVCMYDPKMIINAGLNSWSVDDFVNAVSKTTIDTDMDQMAMSLAQKTTATEAWSTIFQLPAGKTWAQVKVAIKVNTCNGQSQPRPPVVGKICTVLNTLGVPGANIIIYDGALGTCQTLNDGFSKYFSASGTGTYNGYTLYPGVVSSGSGDLGGTTAVAVPNLSGTYNCPADFANGTIDIIVNIAVNKGHNSPYKNETGQGNTGGCTLCHKNHFGTFPINHNNGSYKAGVTVITPADVTSPSNGDTSVYYSMSNAIVGGTPVRQQLCIVDSLWADNNGNPNDAPSLVPARIVMGTFAGAVDYATCVYLKNSTDPGCGGPDANLDLTGQVARFLTLYGYTTADFTAANWVAITPTTSGVLPEAASGGQLHMLEVRLAGGASVARFELPPSTAGAMEIRMFDISGRSVKKMFVELQEGRMSVSWDGKNDHGSVVAPGMYEVRVIAGHYMNSG